jgi:hypothetical protein
MNKKKKNKPQDAFASPDTNPELNTDLEQNTDVFTEDDLDLIFDVTSDTDTLNDDMIQDDDND